MLHLSSGVILLLNDLGIWEILLHFIFLLREKNWKHGIYTKNNSSPSFIFCLFFFQTDSSCKDLQFTIILFWVGLINWALENSTGIAWPSWKWPGLCLQPPGSLLPRHCVLTKKEDFRRNFKRVHWENS